MKKFCILLVGFMFYVSTVLHANNIAVSNVSTSGQNTTAGTNNSANYALVEFDVSWDNSWRTSSGPSNWEAAWVFVKFRLGTGPWQHASLNNTGHVAATVDSTRKASSGFRSVLSSQ